MQYLNEHGRAKSIRPPQFILYAVTLASSEGAGECAFEWCGCDRVARYVCVRMRVSGPGDWLFVSGPAQRTHTTQPTSSLHANYVDRISTHTCFVVSRDKQRIEQLELPIPLIHLNHSDQIPFQEGARKLQVTPPIGGQSFVHVGSYPQSLLHLRNFLPASACARCHFRGIDVSHLSQLRQRGDIPQWSLATRFLTRNGNSPG